KEGGKVSKRRRFLIGFSQPQSQSPQLSQAQQAFQNASANFLQNQVQSGGLPAYTGTLTAPLTPEQQAAIGTEGAVGQIAAPTTAAGLATLGTAATGGLGAASGYAEDPFTKQLVESTRNSFYQNTLPTVTAPFIQ